MSEIEGNNFSKLPPQSLTNQRMSNAPSNLRPHTPEPDAITVVQKWIAELYINTLN